MSFKSVVGIDAVDFAIQAIVTAILAGWAVEVNRPEDAVVFVSMIAVTSLVILGVRRKLAHRFRAPAGLTTGEMAAERVADLEERLDFAERLLADSNSALKSVGPGDPR